MPFTTNGGTATVDKTQGDPHYENMNTPTREEMNAKLEAMEARMDGRVATIQASIDGYLGRQEESARRLDDRLTRMESDASRTRAEIQDNAERNSADMKSLRSTIIITAVSTVLAIVLGVAAFNATVLSNMLASFESGKNTAAAQADVKKQSEETAALLKKLQEQFDAQKVERPNGFKPDDKK